MPGTMQRRKDRAARLIFPYPVRFHVKPAPYGAGFVVCAVGDHALEVVDTFGDALEAEAFAESQNFARAAAGRRGRPSPLLKPLSPVDVVALAARKASPRSLDS